MTEPTASLLYHSGRFRAALGVLQDLAPSEDGYMTAIKCAIELDQLELAENTARQALEHFPKNAKLYYYRGIVAILSLNIAAHPAASEEWFHQAIKLGLTEAHMGLGLVAHQRFRYQEALEYLEKSPSTDPELEHARLLKLFQTYVALGKQSEAEETIIASRRVLAQINSFVRLLWSEIYALKLLWIKGDIANLRTQLRQTLATVDPRSMPRLYRAVLETRRLLDLPTQSSETRFSAVNLPSRNGPVDAIVTKPVLYELYEYLRSSGNRGADKQTIVSRIWQEQYNPMVHDSRLYKAVARLRKLLGDDARNPRVLILKGRTYFLNCEIN